MAIINSIYSSDSKTNQAYDSKNLHNEEIKDIKYQKLQNLKPISKGVTSKENANSKLPSIFIKLLKPILICKYICL